MVAALATTLAYAPQALATAPSPIAYVANAGSTNVTTIATATGTVRSTIPLSNNPISIAIAPDGKTAYVVDGASVTPVDTATGAARPPITVGSNVYGIAITPNGKTAYVAQLTGGVIPVDLATGVVGTPISAGSGPIAIAVTPNGKTAYVADFESTTVTPFDTATGTSAPP